MSQHDFLIVLMTASSVDEAQRIAEALVEESLAACVNLVPGIHSVYKWEGKLARDDEVLLLAKSSRSNFADLERRVTQLHSYDVPEIIAVPLDRISAPYRRFLDEGLSSGSAG